jgi:hypothetical protein
VTVDARGAAAPWYEGSSTSDDGERDDDRLPAAEPPNRGGGAGRFPAAEQSDRGGDGKR